MAWRFEPGERLSDAFRRVAEEEIVKIRAALAAEGADHAKAVHEARQGFKRLRALARLAKPALGGSFARENHRWRDAGRLLAGTRDKTVLLQTYDKLIDGGDPSTDGVSLIRSAIADNGGGGIPNAGEDIDGVLALLDRAAPEVAVLKWPNGTQALFRGLRNGQANLRRKWKHARKSEAPDALHSWRKRVKDQSAQLRLLRRVTPAKVRARQSEEKAVAELLGEEHDLWLLAEWLRGHPLPEDVLPLRDRLLAEIEVRRGALRTEAFRRGEAFSSEKAANLASDLSRAWASIYKRKARNHSRKAEAKS